MSKNKNFVTISDNGDQLETLKALRHIVAETIEKTESGRDIAALTRQMQILLQSISDLEDQREQESETTVLEEVRARHYAARVR